MENELIKYSKAKFEINRLVIDESITEEEWLQIWDSLKQVHGSLQFWIGDWICAGEKKGFLGKYINGKVYDYLQEKTGLKRNTLQHYKSVVEKCCIRIQHLSFGHHQLVTSLPEKNQKQLLQQASKNKWTVSQLREEIKIVELNMKLDEGITLGELKNKMKKDKPNHSGPAIVDKWLKNHPKEKWDDIDIDFLSKFLPLLKALNKQHGVMALRQAKELINMIIQNDIS